jgi:hypothetical protein
VPGSTRGVGILFSENVTFVIWRVDSPEGRPYNPPTADEAARKSANETSETFEKTKKFESSNGLLTD